MKVQAIESHPDFQMVPLDDLVRRASGYPLVMHENMGSAMVNDLGKVTVALSYSSGEHEQIQPMDLIFTAEGCDGVLIVPMQSIFDRVIAAFAKAKEATS